MTAKSLDSCALDASAKKKQSIAMKLSLVAYNECLS